MPVQDVPFCPMLGWRGRAETIAIARGYFSIWTDNPWLGPSTGPFTMPEQQKEGYVHGHPADSHLLRYVCVPMRRPGDRRGRALDEGDRRPHASQRVYLRQRDGCPRDRLCA